MTEIYKKKIYIKIKGKRKGGQPSLYVSIDCEVGSTGSRLVGVTHLIFMLLLAIIDAGLGAKGEPGCTNWKLR